MKTATRTPRERRQERTRQDILLAAIDIIAEEGAEQLSLREIARRIDYSPAALYRHFDSKEAIVDAVCNEATRRLGDSLTVVPETLPPVEYLVELGMAYLRFANDHPQHFRFIATWRVPMPEDITREQMEQAADNPADPFSLLYRAIQRGIDVGLLRVKPNYATLEMALSMWALAHGMAVLQTQRLGKIPMDYARANRQAFQDFIKGMGD
ncbi:MAG: TetR/AcrR family transcriptional regulator [Anaerolineae bacterium]|nr:TetR/AcrR family transcriptional regulator [Anaerolineae bacterium]